MELCEPASGEGMELCEPVPSAVHGLSAEQAAATIEAALASEHIDGVGDGVGDGVAPIELQVDIRQLLGNQADRAAQATDPELELDIIGAAYGPQGHKMRIMIESLRRLVKWDFDDDPNFSSCEGLHLNSTLVHHWVLVACAAAPSRIWFQLAGLVCRPALLRLARQSCSSQLICGKVHNFPRGF